jgi:hypothetical protein
MRLDADVVAWLKQGGPGYQTKANRLLRREMLNHAELSATYQKLSWPPTSEGHRRERTGRIYWL